MLTPINMGRFKRWAIKNLYYHLYPLIVEDFMTKGDCKLVHTPGNIIAPTTGGPCTQAIQGGSNTVGTAKKAVYEARAQVGELQLDVAEETGEFTG